MTLTAEVARQELKTVEAAIQNLRASFRERRLELLDKVEKDRTGREQAELADYDQQFAELLLDKRHWQAEMSKASGPNLKAFRQQRYKLLSVEVSCRKYLDAIAQRLATFYWFPWTYRRQPTIGNVLKAKDGVEGQDWEFIRAVRTHTIFDRDGFQREIKKGCPLLDIPLPQFYTLREWAKISQFNYTTTEGIHDAALPKDRCGQAYVVVRHEDFTDEMKEFLRSIGVRAGLLVHPSDLEIKDEKEVSEGESIVGE